MKIDVAKVFQKKKKQILEQWMGNQLTDDTLRDDLMSNDDLKAQSEELLNAFVKAINDNTIGNPSAPEFDPLLEILTGISISRARQGYSPRETSAYVFSLKEAILKTLRDDISDPASLFDIIFKINKLIDSFGVSTFETFLKGREELILRQTDEIAEISTPVIQLWDGVLGLPIIGTLDSSRTQIVMENLLQKIVDTGSSIAILDISGVPAVDSLVAQHLIKTINATRLMGAECIISGIRPEIAQTVVHLGIDLSHIVTKATLASALKYAFTLLQMEVKKSGKDKLAL